MVAAVNTPVSDTTKVTRDRVKTLRNSPAVRPGRGDLGLLVIVNGVVSTHLLPESGEVVLGRAPDSDVQVIDPSVSRRHAVLRIADEITIEDLGSANGTQLKGQPLGGEPVPVPVGEVVELGSAIVMIQQRPIATREWRIWAHGYFEGRLEDECVRSERSGATFALLRFQSGEENSSVVQQVLANALRSDDVVGLYSPREYEVLAVERSEREADRMTEALARSMRDAGVDVSITTAMFPRDGRSAHELLARTGPAEREQTDRTSRPEVIVESPAMRKIYELVDRVGPSDISVLILGETGVGKEVMAEAVHRASPRRNRPFLRLNCAALSQSLLESELFGHERGAFTGAHRAKRGLLETADGGTVFLDEIGELPMAMQVKLLRVLEERQVWRVGSVKSRSIDVRFVAATNRDLDADLATGRFRHDLFFRLNGVSLYIPALRDRPEEIGPLIQEFVREVSVQQKRSRVPEVAPEALALLVGYSWPGNIRELHNAIERAVLLAADDPIRAEHLPVEKMTATVSTPIDIARIDGARVTGQSVAQPTVPPPAPGSPQGGAEGSDSDMPLADRLRRDIRDVEKQAIVDALNRCGGNQTRAAKELGISRRTLISRLETYGIPRPLKDRHV